MAADNKQPFFKRIEVLIGSIVLVVAAIIGLIDKGEELYKKIKGIFDHTKTSCANFEVSALARIPYYLANTIELGGNKDNLYWLSITGRNGCDDDLPIDAELRVMNTNLASIEEGRFLVEGKIPETSRQETRQREIPRNRESEIQVL